MNNCDVVRCADGYYRRVVYGFGPYIADYPGQVLLACTVSPGLYTCRIAELFVLQPFTAYFPRADIHELLTPDLLHQKVKGTFQDHLVTWVEEYLGNVHGKAG
ncbi:hypothetical protein K466DRAFT_486179 [Polyporus arcularius HHB13444]|uniref:Uncharacterized protein n=1 Tax=Polyporus arcularius HHB13444 TaxID=1314778 RepID=A0A5C3PKE9_9APHY|nr:hypothetical protein K466DRAFT_486179 [Polyporus arcularius HHB13444]